MIIQTGSCQCGKIRYESVSRPLNLTQMVDITNATHVWVSRKLPGIIIPEHAKQFPED